MRVTPRTARAAVGLAAASLLVGACGDVIPDTDPGVETESAVSTPSEPTVTEPPFTPVTEDTTVARDTTAEPAPDGAPDTAAPDIAATPAAGRDDLVLRAEGVGTADFGQSETAVIPYVSGILGTPTTDRLGEFPAFDEASGVFVDAEEDAFAFPFSRTACYDNQFCVYFGGETSDALTFVGWSQEGFEALTDPLQTAEGITVGSRQSDHVGAMTVNQGGCFSSGTGDAAGVLLFVTSEGEPFEFVDDDGNFVQGNPEPSDIVVQSMEAGDRPFFLFADC